MKRIIVIGLGSFGISLVKALSKKKMEVIAVDINSQRVNEIKDIATQPVTMDATKKDNLLSLGVNDVDCVIVSSGPDLESSILIVYLLKELGVSCIIGKALSEDHKKILQLVGATEIIFPEKDIAVKLANQINSPNLIDYLPLESGFVIEEIAPPDVFIGKTLHELKIRNKYNVNVIAIKQIIPDKSTVNSDPADESGLTINPGGNFTIKESDILIVLGSEKDIINLHKKIKN